MKNKTLPKQKTKYEIELEKELQVIKGTERIINDMMSNIDKQQQNILHHIENASILYVLNPFTMLKLRRQRIERRHIKNMMQSLVDYRKYMVRKDWI